MRIWSRIPVVCDGRKRTVLCPERCVCASAGRFNGIAGADHSGGAKEIGKDTGIWQEKRSGERRCSRAMKYESVQTIKGLPNPGEGEG